MFQWTNDLWKERSRVYSFPGTKVPGTKSSRELTVQGTNVPENESSTVGTNSLENESSIILQRQLEYEVKNVWEESQKNSRLNLSVPLLLAPYSDKQSKANKKLSWCWQTRTTHLEVSQDHQTVAFHMLGIVSSCAIVTLSLRRAVFRIFDFKECRDLEIGSEVTQGHWKWLHSIDCIRFNY